MAHRSTRLCSSRAVNMSLIANIDRILERNQQLENDNQTLRDIALQAEDDRNQSVEVEVQRRLKSAAEELLSTKHERDDLRRDLEIAERNLLQRPDDHSKVEQLEPIVARQVDEIQRHEKEILDLKVRLGTKGLQLDKVKKEKDQLQSTLDNANNKF